MEMAMMVMDGSPTGRADPAFDAHSGVIGHWAQAVWYTGLRTDRLQSMIDDAFERTAAAQEPWRVCYGPAAALILTCERIGWQVLSATEIKTDLGRIILLLNDPPIVVTKLCDEAVRRWRWRNLRATHQDLPQAGASMRPI